MAKERLFNRGRFTFVGAGIFGKTVVDTKKLNDEWSRTRLNFGVKVGTNTQFLNAEFMHSDKVKKVKLFGSDGEQFEVNLSDTGNEDVINRVADFSKITVDLETDKEIKDQYYSLFYKIRNHENKEEQTQDDIDKIKEYREQIKELSANIKQFVHMKDVIQYINDNQEVINKNKIRVTGDVKVNYYNGKARLNFIPKNFKLLVADTDTIEELRVNIDIFFDRESIDNDTKEQKMYINGYVGDVVKKAEKLFPTQIVFDYSRVDMENAQQKALVDYMTAFFVEDVKSKKKLYKLPVICSVVNGAEVVEFSMDTLTDRQKTAIALGLAKLDDYKPKGNIFGDRVTFTKLMNADLALSPEGTVEAMDLDDLFAYLPSDDSDKKVDEVKEEKPKEEESKSKEPNQDEIMRALFG